jgi:hypothetical protein
MVDVFAKSVVLALCGVLVFFGLEGGLSKFIVDYQLWILVVGIVLIYLAGKVNGYKGLVRVVGGSIVFLAVKPWLLPYMGYWYFFVVAGLLGMIFADSIVRMVES